jgi:transcription antitermination factor NusG
MDDQAKHKGALVCGSYCPRWFIVQTHWREETIAAEQLVNQGFTAYLPEHVVEPARGKRAQRDNVVVDSAGHIGRRLPLFPRYLFVFFDFEVDYWRPICSTRGVERMFGITPERPTPVPYGVVEELLETPEISAVFAPPKLDGKKLRVTGAGPWHQFEGICQWSSDRRVGILMSVFGREGTVVPFKRNQVEVV